MVACVVASSHIASRLRMTSRTENAIPAITSTVIVAPVVRSVSLLRIDMFRIDGMTVPVCFSSLARGARSLGRRSVVTGHLEQLGTDLEAGRLHGPQVDFEAHLVVFGE